MARLSADLLLIVIHFSPETQRYLSIHRVPGLCRRFGKKPQSMIGYASEQFLFRMLYQDEKSVPDTVVLRVVPPLQQRPLSCVSYVQSTIPPRHYRGLLIRLPLRIAWLFSPGS